MSPLLVGTVTVLVCPQIMIGLEQRHIKLLVQVMPCREPRDAAADDRNSHEDRLLLVFNLTLATINLRSLYAKHRMAKS